MLRFFSIQVTFVCCLALLVHLPVAAQTGEILPNPNLVADGIPKIPASLAEDVGRYTKGRGADLLDWAPPGQGILIATSFGNTPQIHLVRSPGATRTQLTFFDDRPTRGVSFEPKKGRFFIFRKDVGGNQMSQIYRYDLASSEVTLLTDGKSMNSTAVWSTTGDRIAYTSLRRTGRDMDVYVMNPLDPKTDRMVAELTGAGWSVEDWSPDGRQLLLREYISINESYLWLLELGTGQKILVTPKNGVEKVSYSSPRFRKDGRGLYVLTDRGSEFQQLAYFDLATKGYRFITRAYPWDVYEYSQSPDGKWLGVVINADGLFTLRLINAVTGMERRLPGFPAGYAFGLRWRNDSRYLGFSMDSARTTADAYSLDVSTGKVERWTYSEVGPVDTSTLREPELVRWKSFDGTTISGFLYRPPARFTGPRPVIVEFHGGPEVQFLPYFLGSENYLLNELGVALFKPNIRGSSGYGKSFLKLDNGLLRENGYRDAESVLDWIKTRRDLDADRIMVTGVSYGGHMSLIVSTRYPDRIRCAVDIVGPSNLATFLERTAGFRQELRRAEYGDERDPTMRAFFERTAPVNNISNLRKPLFVIQGQNDPAVAPSESEQIVRAVRKNGVTVWYLLAKDEGHGFSKRSNSDFAFYATVMFVRDCLLK